MRVTPRLLTRTLHTINAGANYFSARSANASRATARHANAWHANAGHANVGCSSSRSKNAAEAASCRVIASDLSRVS